ncbi:MAG: hypothetical protein ACRCYK_05210 [Aeromonas hydrophila]
MKSVHRMGVAAADFDLYESFEKTFVVTDNASEFQKGDVLRLITGYGAGVREIDKEIGFVSGHKQEKGVVVLGFACARELSRRVEDLEHDTVTSGAMYKAKRRILELPSLPPEVKEFFDDADKEVGAWEMEHWL